MSHQTIVIREEDTTLRIEQVVVPSRDPLQTSTIRLPVGGGPLIFVDENDGLLLTLDKDGNIISEKGFFEFSGQAEPDLSPTSKARLYFDSTNNRLRLSENGGGYVDFLGGAGDVTGPGSATDNQIVRFDGATGKLIQTANAVIADDGSPTFNGTGLWTVNGLSGFGAALRNSAGQVFLDYAINKGAIIQGTSFDTATAFGFAVATVNTLTTAGANLFEVWNGLKDVGSLKFFVDKDGIISLPAGLVTLDPAAPGIFDMGFNNIATVRLNSNGGFELRAADVVALTLGLAVEADHNTSITSVRGGTKAFGFRTNTAGTSSAGIGFMFQSVNNTSLWDDVDAAFISIEPAITGIGTGRQVWKINGFGDTYWIADDAGDNAVVDSPELILRANYDADAGAGVTPTLFEALIKHNMLTAGGSPTSQLDFLVDSAVRLSLPSAAPAAYTRNATIVTDRTLLASASATTINNNNVVAALIEDLKARNLIG